MAYISPEKAKFLWAERQQESGGNYGSVNKSSGALGAYQILPSNLSAWEKKAGIAPEAPGAFLKDAAAQDAVATVVLGGYFDRYGDAGAAAMWYSGQPDPNKTYGNPPVSTYVQEVLSKEKQAPSGWLPGGSGAQSGSATPVGTTGIPFSPLAGAVLGGFGLSSWQDGAERLGLILLGGILIVMGILRFTGSDKTIVDVAKLAATRKVGNA